MSPNRFDFQPAHFPPEAFDYHFHMKAGLSKAEAKQTVQKFKSGKTFLSDTYQVDVHEIECKAFAIALTWLSIKRRDKEAFHDWREMQSIKNAILGPNREAVELYPAESRLVDTSNQYHLWALPAGMSWPFGYHEREVLTPEQAGAIGAKQREIS